MYPFATSQAARRWAARAEPGTLPRRINVDGVHLAEVAGLHVVVILRAIGTDHDVADHGLVVVGREEGSAALPSVTLRTQLAR